MNGVTVYATGLVYSSVCAPNDADRDAVEVAANFQNPTGIASPWKVAEEAFTTGNPHPCEKDASRSHWLLVC